MKPIISKLVIAFCCSFLIPTSYVMAGGPGFGGHHGGGGPGFNTDVDDGCDVPLDGGLSILAASGAAYAVVRSYRNKKNNKK